MNRSLQKEIGRLIQSFRQRHRCKSERVSFRDRSAVPWFQRDCYLRAVPDFRAVPRPGSRSAQRSFASLITLHWVEEEFNATLPKGFRTRDGQVAFAIARWQLMHLDGVSPQMLDVPSIRERLLIRL